MKAKKEEISTNQIEEEIVSYHEIDKLQEQGINAADINKLKMAGM
jgi:hypothetical protein